MSAELWPEPAFEAAVALFGGAVYNLEGRTRKTLDRAIAAVLARWRQRYEMTPAQDEYAAEVLAWAIRQGHVADSALPYVVSVLASVVNDERVHEGFKRRSGWVDVSAQVKEGLSAV